MHKCFLLGLTGRFSGTVGPLSLSAGYFSDLLLLVVSGTCLNPYPEATHPVSCYHLSLPGLGSRGGSRAGLALIIT